MTRRGRTWTPTARDFSEVFREQNPWHATGEVPVALAPRTERYLARSLWNTLLRAQPQRFQLILGPRRVGKTTCMYQTVRRLLQEGGVHPQRLWWLRLDHPLLMDVEMDQLVRLVIDLAKASASEPVFLFLDELTYAHRWDGWLKTFFDDQWPVRLVGTSSATAALRRERVESGVGRWEEQYLAPYLFSEFLELMGQDRDIPVADHLAATLEACIAEGVSVVGLSDLRRRFLITGGFPELLLANRDQPQDEASVLLHSQRILRTDAVERAIYKDIPQVFDIDNPLTMERLLYTLAGQMAGIISPGGICADLPNLSKATFDRYLNYLIQAYLVFVLPNYSGNETTVQKRGRKIYFVDGAIRNAALQRGLGPLSDLAEMGLLLENMSAAHLHALSQQSQDRLYHWREGRDEVDLVLDHPTHALAFEITVSHRHPWQGLRRLTDRFPKFCNRAYLVSASFPAMRPSHGGGGLGTLPMDLLLLAAGKQAERQLAARLR